MSLYNNVITQAIFLQIASTLKERILQGIYKEEEKLPSVRELAIEMEVNPNTVMRAYERLQMSGIIYAKRGLGQFVTPEAKAKILDERKHRFLTEIVPAIKEEMRLLGLQPQEIFEKE